MFHSGENAQCARTGHPLKITSPTKLARPSNFLPASLAGPEFYVYVFSLVADAKLQWKLPSAHARTGRSRSHLAWARGRLQGRILYKSRQWALVKKLRDIISSQLCAKTESIYTFVCSWHFYNRIEKDFGNNYFVKHTLIAWDCPLIGQMNGIFLLLFLL